jgi:hypothetical protein
VKTLYPYDVVVGDIKITIENVVIDGKTLSTDYINPDFRTVAFADLDTDRWDEAVIDIVVTGPEVELRRDVFSDTAALLQVGCGPSSARLAVSLKRDDRALGRWTGSATLERDNWYGTAQLRATVHAKVDGIANRTIGESQVWTISFDDAPPSPVHGSINVQWLDFSEDAERPYLKAFRDDTHYVRLDADDPSLYLNRAFDGLEPLLVDRRRRPPGEQALHDSTVGNIASDAWGAMFFSALSSIEINPETSLPDWPSEEWRTVVLKAMFARIYPDLGMDDALVAAVEARDAFDSAGELIERVFPAVGRQVGAPRTLRTGMTLLEKDEREDQQ